MTEFSRSPCPIAHALDLVGDRWTLLVVRNAFAGARRFGEFAKMPEAIPSNVLAERLKRLVAAGVLERRPYQSHPPRYEYHLTPRGADFLPVLQAMAAWSARHAEGTWQPPAWFAEGVPADFIEN